VWGEGRNAWIEEHREELAQALREKTSREIFQIYGIPKGSLGRLRHRVGVPVVGRPRAPSPGAAPPAPAPPVARVVELHRVRWLDMSTDERNVWIEEHREELDQALKEKGPTEIQQIYGIPKGSLTALKHRLGVPVRTGGPRNWRPPDRPAPPPERPAQEYGISEWGISQIVTHRLKELGYTSGEEVARVPDNELLAIEGVGEGTINRLRKLYPQITPGPGSTPPPAPPTQGSTPPSAPTTEMVTLDAEDFRVLVNGGTVITWGLQIRLGGVEFEAMDDAIARARHNRDPWPGGCGPECAANLEKYPQRSGMYYLCFTHAQPVPPLWTAAARTAALAGQVPEYEGRAKTYHVYGG